jgi:hypothetical protein
MLPCTKTLKEILHKATIKPKQEEPDFYGGWCDDLYYIELTHEDALNLVALSKKYPKLKVSNEELDKITL